MIYSALQTREATFRNKVSSFLTPVKVPVKGENLTLEAFFYKPNGERKYFFSTEFQKQRIVLHFTAGSISSDIDTLTQENGNCISVPFVIARDGTIYQLFGSAAWARHLGPGVGNEKGMNNAQDKITIGIEISNYGYLTEKDGNLETIYSRTFNKVTQKFNPPQIYCSLAETEAYQKLDTPYRGQSYYATHTDEQYESLIILLRFLTAKYDIPRVFLPEDKRFTQTTDVLNFKGIVSHVNYRKDKWDIGNAFDWNRLISGVQANVFEPQLATASLMKDFSADVISSEEEITKQLPFNEEPKEEITKDLQDNMSENSDKPKKLYGLLVGINDYKGFPLGGCINDMNNIKNYLEKKSGLETTIQTLQNKEATKTAIVAAFRTHLTKATKDDTVVFYFSGHGTKENADPIWEKDSTSSGLECMVCYNEKPNYLLADKEVRFLLHELWTKTQAHIVVITDCCHSADNTRGELIKESFKKKSKVKERRIKLAVPFDKRAWKDFVFGDTITFDFAKSKEKVSDFLPEGNHIHLAACELDESALEVDRNGVFTTNLIKVLENSAGNVSYHSLQSRIRNYMQALYEQKPRVFSKDSSSLNLIFLNKGLEENKQASEIIFAGSQGWKLNLGAVHGIKKAAIVEVLNNQNCILTNGKVEKVFVDYSLVTLNVDSLDKKLAYQTTVVGAMTSKLNIQLNNYDTNPEDLKKTLDSLDKNAGGSYEFNSAGVPDYTLHFKYGRAYLTKFNDDFRPLFYPLGIYSPKFDEVLVRHLRAVSRWNFVAGLKNENPSGLLNNPLEIEFVNAISGKTIEIVDGKVKLDFEEGVDGWAGQVKIKIKNVSKQKLYVCIAYLSAEFGVMFDLLPSGSKSQLIEANKETFLEFDGEKVIDCHLSDTTEQYNLEFSAEKFNFIISTTPFNANALAQDDLPAPPVLADADTRGTDKSLGKKQTDKKLNLDDWTTQKLDIEFVNPLYNIVKPDRLKEMLAFEDMAEFVIGNYYDIVPDEQLQPSFRIKLSFKVPESERSFFQDMVMEAANRVENVLRRVAYNSVKNNPNRMRIVAEGDSWFLYPFILKEIIDQLSPLYAIRSVAEAGDTLSNYLKTNEYKRAIEQENPKLFLVSGGGNDILGVELEEYIKENSVSGLPPTEYLTPKFEEALVKLDTLYRQMFNSISTPTIVHGYDYIFPVDRNVSNAKSWAGEFMFNKKIKNPADQRRIIIHLIDRFNEVLKKLDFDFAHVHYLDVRNSVPNPSDWKDEIHPTDVGFNAIAIKFTHKINDLINRGEIKI